MFRKEKKGESAGATVGRVLGETVLEVYALTKRVEALEQAEKEREDELAKTAPSR